MATLLLSGASFALRSSLNRRAALALGYAFDLSVGDGDNFSLALIMGDRKARVAFDARQSLLRLVENAPCLLDRYVECLVSDDVAAAKEIMVLDAVAAQFALHDPQGCRVVVDTLDDRRLVVDAEPLALPSAVTARRVFSNHSKPPSGSSM